MPHWAYSRHIEVILSTLPYFNDSVVKGRKEKQNTELVASLKTCYPKCKTLLEKNCLDKGKECYTGGMKKNRK